MTYIIIMNFRKKKPIESEGRQTKLPKSRNYFQRKWDSHKNKNCTQLSGEFHENLGICDIENISDSNKRIFAVEKRGKLTKYTEDDQKYYLHYFDLKGNKKSLPTNIQTVENWINYNQNFQNINKPFHILHKEIFQKDDILTDIPMSVIQQSYQEQFDELVKKIQEENQKPEKEANE